MASRRMIQHAGADGVLSSVLRDTSPCGAAPQHEGLVGCYPSPPTRGRGDLGEQSQDVQLAVEIEFVRLALRGADAIP
jgi:hypothetical protein